MICTEKLFGKREVTLLYPVLAYKDGEADFDQNQPPHLYTAFRHLMMKIVGISIFLLS